MSEQMGAGPAGVIVLTDIVEEGLPLDKLPDLPGEFREGAGRNRNDECRADPIPDVDLEVMELDLEAFMMQDAEERKTGGLEPVSGGVEAAADDIAGDAGALLDDEEFAEIEFPEDPDPVLAGLQNAGLRRAGVTTPGSGPECESPDDYLVDEDQGGSSGDDQAGPVGSGSSLTSNTEEEISSSLAATIRRQVEAAAPRSSSAEPQVCPEPTAPDFSRQIESLTQEWSKQLLQSTYASMDKMIQAVGDLAPTIVDRVAREIIPPLAEQVIKAEIARLEARLEGDESDDEDGETGSGAGPGPARKE